MIYQGDCLDILPTIEANSIQCCVTSPPYYGLRDYGCEGQIGLESTPEAYVEKLVAVFREVRRVLADDGTLWLNLGDSYANNKDGNTQGSSTSGLHYTNPNKDLEQFRNEQQFKKRVPLGLKPKDLIGIPWRVAFALQADGWWLRQDIIWHKPNPMPESVRDRCTKAHEYIFLLSKAQRYYFDAEAIAEPLATEPHAPGNKCGTDGGHLRNDFGTSAMEKVWGASGVRNKRSVWSVTTKPFSGAHFAVFPPEIPEICIKAGSRPGDTILDPFSGAGTTGNVAERLGREYVGIELNPAYSEMGEKRIDAARLPLFMGLT